MLRDSSLAKGVLWKTFLMNQSILLNITFSPNKPVFHQLVEALSTGMNFTKHFKSTRNHWSLTGIRKYDWNLRSATSIWRPVRSISAMKHLQYTKQITVISVASGF